MAFHERASNTNFGTETFVLKYAAFTLPGWTLINDNFVSILTVRFVTCREYEVENIQNLDKSVFGLKSWSINIHVLEN